MKQSVPKIVNVRMKPTKAIAARPKIKASYEAAREGRRADGWSRASDMGPETSGRLNYAKLRKRSRFEARNHAVASRIVDVIVAETIGQGLRPRITDDDQLAALWSKFVQESDADGVQSFYGQQSLAMRDIIIAGEAFARFRPRRLSDGLPVPMQIQLLSSEFLPYDVPQRADSRSGIVFSGPGQRSGYMFHPVHPGEFDRAIVSVNDLTFVAADRVAHIYSQREIGQLRGEPWLTRAIVKIHDLDGYVDAEMVRKKLASMIAFFVEMPASDGGTVMEAIDEDGNLITVDAAGNPIDDPYEILPSVEPGATLPLPPGAKMSQSTPMEVGGSFDPFIRQIMREICAAVSVPYELITGDWSGVNDRLARVSLQRFYMLVRQWRQMMIRQFCRPSWIQFLEAAQASGAWKPAEGKTVADYACVSWVGDPFPHVHPVQEVQADVDMIRAGIKTRAEAIIERGGDPEVVRKERAAELAADDAAGIVADTDPRVKKAAPPAPEKPTKEGAENDETDDIQGPSKAA